MENKFIVSPGKHSDQEKQMRNEFLEFFLNKNPVPKEELFYNIGLYINRQTLSRIIYMNELYQKILDVPGVIMEFGVRWGTNLALFENFRGMYEPYRNNRKVIGFDTFSGYPDVSESDINKSNAAFMKKGAYDMPDNYEEILDYILRYHEKESPISHIKKYEIVKGDVCNTLCEYLENNPHTMIALAYFDINLYEPAKECLKRILPHMAKGSIIGFDELNYSGFPGETIALKEVLGLPNVRIHASRTFPSCSFMYIE
ncbi:hypothetical protein [Sporomusa aerivorans]|uniref:hypothetical protein n=1 Tax=Sporomusa aerivorans TaxID=204936 RepID=UPI00352ABFF6